MTTPTGILFFDPQAKPLSTTGQFQAGAYLIFYLTGTTTPANVYQDGALTTPLSQTPGASQPSCTADSAGRFNQIYLNPATTYRVQLYNATGSKLEDTDPYVVPQPVTQSVITAILYPQSQAEINASVTPSSTLYPWGDLRRYGADPTGVAASDTALSNACLCNSDVFDGYPGGGTYLFNTGVTLTHYPVTIRGQAKNNTDIATNVGTIFKLATAAGAGAAVLQASYIDGLRVQNIGFQFQSGSLSQFGINIKTISATAGQMRSCIVESCAFVGTGVSDTNIGIQVLSGTGGSQYSAFNVFRDNYFTAISGGIAFQGNATPNMIYGNSFLGHTGAASAAAGYGVYVQGPGAEIKLSHNYFEGWVNAIYANQATNIQQVANDFQSCTNGYNWIASSGVINNQSIGDTGVAGIYSGESNLDGSQMQMAGRLGWLATGGAIQSTRGFQEGSGAGSNLRTALLGYHTTSAPTMTANGGGSISAQTTNTFTFATIGGTLLVDFNITATLTGSSTTTLSVPIPLSLTSIVASQNPCSLINNGATVLGVASVAASGSAINFTLLAGSDFTAGSIGASGQIMIRVVS